MSRKTRQDKSTCEREGKMRDGKRGGGEGEARPKTGGGEGREKDDGPNENQQTLVLICVYTAC